MKHWHKYHLIDKLFELFYFQNFDREQLVGLNYASLASESLHFHLNLCGNFLVIFILLYFW